MSNTSALETSNQAVSPALNATSSAATLPLLLGVVPLYWRWLRRRTPVARKPGVHLFRARSPWSFQPVTACFVRVNPPAPDPERWHSLVGPGLPDPARVRAMPRPRALV